jgi:hypothetical protein
MGVLCYGQFVKKQFGVANSIKYHTIIFETLELNTPGFFIKKKEKMSIDYSKLNDRIVKQAWDYRTAFLNQSQVQRLFQNKIDRAAAMIRAQEQFRRLAQDKD